MFNIKTQINGVMLLGLLSLAAGSFAHLALTDIYHAEADVTFEWNIVRLAALIILLFIGSALFMLNKSRKLISR